MPRIDDCQVADRGLVSIVMPSYNTSKLISASIESVVKQTYQNWELIIVDDCSSDDTEEVVESFDDRRITFIKNEHNEGAAHSRNVALRKASGKWIAFLDSDDIWFPTKLEKQLAFMLDNECAFSCTDYLSFNKANGLSKTVITAPDVITKGKMTRYCYPGALTVMYDRDVVGLVQIPKIKRNNDYALWLEVVQNAEMRRLPECLALYRKRDNSISSVSKIELTKYHYRLFRQCRGHGRLKSGVNTAGNLVFGAHKKVFYKRNPTVVEERSAQKLADELALW